MSFKLNTITTAWTNLLQNVHVGDTIAAQYFEEILQHYSSKGRYYHNLQHLSELLTWLQNDALQINDWQAVYASVFYHDIIYNPLRKDNEQKSAEIALERLRKMGFDNTLGKKVYAWIVATQTHRASPEMAKDSDCLHFLDADLAILGAPIEKYEQYRQAVRREYTIFPDFIYRKGRKKALTQLLESPRLFATPFFNEKLEQQARANMLRELNGL